MQRVVPSVPAMREVATATPEVERSAPLSTESPAWRTTRHVVVFAAVVILAHLPLFVWHLWSLWLYRPHYQFYPLLLAGVAWLAWKRWPQFSAQTPPPRWSTALLTGGLLVLAASVLFFSPWVAAVATVLSVGGLIGRFAVRGQGRNWLPMWAVMWLIVPPPFRWDFRLIVWLQSSTSQMASMLLDIVGVRHLMEGNVLVLPGHRLLVEQACSGVNSLLVLLAVTALFVAAAQRPLLWAALLLVSSFAWAWLANVARVVAVALSQGWYQVDLSSGWRHELLGYAAIALALVLLASTDRSLAFLLRPIAPRAGELPLQVMSEENPLSWAWNWLVRAGRQTGGGRGGEVLHPALDALPRQNAGGFRDYGWLGAFGLLGTLQIVCFVVPAVSPDIHLATVPRLDMPASLRTWTLVKHEQVEREHNDHAGQFSSQWWYRREPLVCQISVDYPFSDWHELTDCYTGGGWQRIGRRVVSDGGEGSREGPCVEVELSKPTGEYGWLLFGLLDQAGNDVSTSTGGWPRVTAKLARSPLGSRLLGRDEGRVAETAYQVQAFVSSAVRLSPAQRAEVRRLFVAARSQVFPADLRKANEAERKP